MKGIIDLLGEFLWGLLVLLCEWMFET